VLWLHAVGLAFFGLAQGYSPAHSLLDAALVAAPAALADAPGLRRGFRMLAAAFGLVTASALVVHLSGGLIEAHFHFFVVIPLLILYQHWSPFLLALVYVVVHHGALGALTPSAVYNHPDAIAHPWKWAFIHGVFVLGSSAANLVSWRANEQMLHEPLTGLPGRAVFLHRVALALDRIRRRRSTVAVLFLDLDRFKLLNDTLGHGIGDHLLVAVAGRLRATVRSSDTVARLGGDEFAILCEDVVDKREVVNVADRVERALARPFRVGSSEVVIGGASIGIALTSVADTPLEELIGDADRAMYRAKAHPGKRWVVFDERMRREDAQRLATEEELRRALANDELALVYQPIVSLGESAIVGAEALLRWRHPDRGELAPAEFLDVAEQTGLIVPIGRWVLEHACREAATWVDGPYLSVNLSAREFAEPRLVETVADVLAATGLDPGRLCLEITESELMDEVHVSVARLAALKQLGVRIVLDDFGTGHSSLRYLSRFPIDVVKVDRSFVAALGSTDGGVILAAVAQIADSFGIVLVAEGVETPEQLERLGSLGYQFGQGYCFAHPEPAEAFRGRLGLLGDRLELVADPVARVDERVA
jgi:diguanylate cyclase (GGDEF)-like protein